MKTCQQCWKIYEQSPAETTPTFQKFIRMKVHNRFTSGKKKLKSRQMVVFYLNKTFDKLAPLQRIHSLRCFSNFLNATRRHKLLPIFAVSSRIFLFTCFKERGLFW